MIPSDSLQPRELAALLHFYADAGVDWMLDDQPVDRFAEYAAERQARSQRAAAQAPAQVPARSTGAGPQAAPPRAQSTAPIAVPDGEAVAEARRVAATAQTLEALREAISGFEFCNLKRSARHALFATGAVQSGIMVIGSVPDADEDRDGIPFAGASGVLFDRMLASIGLSRDRVVLTTALPWRPPGNRMPYQAEMDICRPFLDRQIELCAPKAVLILGNFTSRFLLGPEAAMHQVRGEWHDLGVGGLVVPALTSLHPHDLLLAAQNKRLAWQDLLRFRMKLKDIALIEDLSSL